MSETQQPEQKARVIKSCTNTARVTGAVLMLAGVACFFNLGGIADVVGLADGETEKILGGSMFLIGIIDFFVVPGILAKRLEDNRNSQI